MVTVNWTPEEEKPNSFIVGDLIPGVSVFQIHQDSPDQYLYLGSPPHGRYQGFNLNLDYTGWFDRDDQVWLVGKLTSMNITRIQK